MRITRLCLILVSILLIGNISTSVVSYASSDSPSKWATSEVEQAINSEIVPEELLGNYNGAIKRYEYVLLALEVLDKAGVNLYAKHQYAFKDILGHPYENEILQAYNSGIILGDGKGYFKPDDVITRQEVASLIVKLLKVISPNKDFLQNNNFDYSDNNNISNWAKKDINYCYANGIIKGIGKDKKGLDIINPLGTATREESIILIYRLANSEKIINDESIGEIELDNNTKFDLTSFSKQFGIEATKKLLSYNEHQNISIIEASDTFITIKINENADIILFKLNNGLFLELSSKEKISNDIKKTYLELLSTLNNEKYILDTFDKGINNLNDNKDSYYEIINNKFTISIKFDITLDEEYYFVRYFESIY